MKFLFPITISPRFLGGALGLAACLFAAASSAKADDAEPAAASGVSISIVGLGELPASLRFQQGGKVLNAPIPAGGRSAAFRYTGGTPLVLFEEVTDAEGKVMRVPRATAAFSEDWKQILLVLLPGDNPAAMLRPFTFDDSREAFPPEHVRLFNFYFSAVAVSANGTIDQIEAGTSKLLPLPPRDSLGRIWMKMAALRNGRWEVLPTWITQCPPSARLLTFAYEQRNGAGDLMPVYRTISETPPPPAQAAPKIVVRR